MDHPELGAAGHRCRGTTPGAGEGDPGGTLSVASDYLFAYSNRDAYEADRLVWDLRQREGFEWSLLDGPALRDFEPSLGDAFTFAARLSDHATVRDPGRYVKALAAVFTAAGGEFRRAAVTGFATDSDNCGPSKPMLAPFPAPGR